MHQNERPAAVAKSSTFQNLMLAALWLVVAMMIWAAPTLH